MGDFARPGSSPSGCSRLRTCPILRHQRRGKCPLFSKPRKYKNVCSTNAIAYTDPCRTGSKGLHGRRRRSHSSVANASGRERSASPGGGDWSSGDDRPKAETGERREEEGSSEAPPILNGFKFHRLDRVLTLKPCST